MRARVSYWLAPGLRSVELSAADYGSQRFSPHWHGGFAIGVVTRQAQGFRSLGREWLVEPGDLVLLNPGQPHDGYAVGPDGWSSRMAYVPAPVFRGLAGIGGAAGAWRFPQPCVRARDLAARFGNWHRLAEHADVGANAATTGLFRALAELLQPGAPSGLDPLDAAAWRDRIGRGEEGPVPTVGALGDRLHLSRSSVWRRVKARTGLAPKPALKHLRLIEAKDLLARGVAPVEAAAACGFHDQSHFARQFAAAYGFTPAQFRRAHLDGAARAR